MSVIGYKILRKREKDTESYRQRKRKREREKERRRERAEKRERWSISCFETLYSVNVLIFPFAQICSLQ